MRPGADDARQHPAPRRCGSCSPRRVHRRYVSTLEETLQQHRLDAERADTPVVDRETEEVLAARLGAADPQEILYALDVMALGRQRGGPPRRARPARPPERGGARARPADPRTRPASAPCCRRAEALLRDPAIEVRTEALLYLARHSDIDPVARVQDLGDYPDSSVRAALVAVLARLGGDRLEAARPVFELMVAEAGPAGRRDAARGGPARRADRAAVRGAAAAADRATRTRRSRRRRSAPPPRHGPTPFVDAIAARLDDAALAGAGRGRARRRGRRRAAAPLARVLAVAVVAVRTRRRRGGVRARAARRTPTAASVLADHLLDADAALRLRILGGAPPHEETPASLAVDARPLEAALGAEILGHYRSYQILGTVDGRRPRARADRHGPARGDARGARADLPPARPHAPAARLPLGVGRAAVGRPRDPRPGARPARQPAAARPAAAARAARRPCGRRAGSGRPSPSGSSACRSTGPRPRSPRSSARATRGCARARPTRSARSACARSRRSSTRGPTTPTRCCARPCARPGLASRPGSGRDSRQASRTRRFET